MTRRQRGAITILTASFTLVAVLCMVLVIDSGRLYLAKRDLQRVADVSAIEAVARGADCVSPGALATSYASQAAIRNGFDSQAGTLVAECGRLSSSNGERVFTVDATGLQTIRVTLTRPVPASLIAGGLFGGDVTLRAVAVASRGVPLAALTLRTTVASIDSTQATLLNAVLGGLLGGSLSLDALGYNGLVSSQINLFDFLDSLKTTLNLSAGGYDQVLGTQVTVGQVLTAGADALSQQSGTASTTAALGAINLLKLAAGPTTLVLDDVLNLQTGTSYAGADAQVNLFDLLRSSILLANRNSAVASDISLPLAGGGGVALAIKVIEPPQLSAIGNPALAVAEAPTYDGPNRIFVKSSQVRLYTGISLGTVIQVVDNVLNGVLQLASPVTSFLQNALSLNIFSAIDGLLNSVLCGGFLQPACNSFNVTYVKTLANNVRLDIAAQVGSGEARVTGYSCGPGAAKTLTVPAKTSVADLRIGRIGTDSNGDGTVSQAESKSAVFANQSLPNASSIPILEFGRQVARPRSCLLTLCSNWEWYKASTNTWVSNRNDATYYPEAGLALRVGSENSGLGMTQQTLTYTAPAEANLPEINASTGPAYQRLQSTPDLLSTLGGLISDINLEAYRSQSSGVVGTLLTTGIGTINGVKDGIQDLVSSVLTPLLTPVLQTLFPALGLGLGISDVGANLSCSSSQGVSLVQ